MSPILLAMATGESASVEELRHRLLNDAGLDVPADVLAAATRKLADAGALRLCRCGDEVTRSRLGAVR